MTYSSHTKVLGQIGTKPAKVKKYNKYNVPKSRSNGKALYKCERCGTPIAHISKYGISLCRKCFREIAVELGFRKYE